jgi:DNA-binding SARP family transcriptional activator
MVNNVRHFVHALRGRLEPDRGKRAPSRFILSDVGGYRLNPETVTVDADHFERGVRTGLKCMETGDADAANIHLVEALRLYGGDFLAEERYALWTYAERDRLRGLAGQALAALSEIRLRANDVEGASHYIDRLADMHPFDPEVQRSSLMIALRLGRHTLARNRYQALRRRLMEEFGSEPAFSLRDLMVELENGSELGAARGWT